MSDRKRKWLSALVWSILFYIDFNIIASIDQLSDRQILLIDSNATDF